ncbi:hypothetical protein [Thermocatellispora tengchongensis]
MRIGDLARAAAAPGWSRLTVRRAQVGTLARTTVTRDGEPITVAGLDEPFQRLREVSWTEGAGTWFTCELTFTPGTRGYTGRVDDTDRPFEDTVPGLVALGELAAHPRDRVPPWLLDALPTAVPLPLPQQPGHRDTASWPGGGKPVPAISGELAYVPATRTTVGGFELVEERDRTTLVFTDGRAGHDRLICVGHGSAYWIARPEASGTNTGVRSITLDGAVLRFDLTTEAADAMWTGPTFEVRLDLPPDRLTALRAALGRVLAATSLKEALVGL